MSRELFDQLCDDPKSAVIIPGYMVKGTFSESVGATFSKGEMIPTLSGDMKPFNIRVEGTLRTPLFCSVCLNIVHAAPLTDMLVVTCSNFLFCPLRLPAVVGPDHLNQPPEYCADPW
jgi:hypothetical protein